MIDLDQLKQRQRWSKTFNLLLLLKLLFMIIASQHSHQTQIIMKPSRKRKVNFDADEETKLNFENLLSKSEKSINSDAQAVQLQNMRKNSEDKVYANLKSSANDFLFILLKAKNQKIEKDASLVQQILQNREKEVIKALKLSNLSISKSSKSIQAIKDELEEQLEILRMKNPEKSIPPQYYEEMRRREEQKYENHAQFRRHSYWKIPNQKHQSALQLISNLRNHQKIARQNYERSLSMSLRKKKEEQEQQIKEKAQQFKKQKEILHQRYNQYKLQRQKEIKLQAEKKRKIQESLAKYKSKAPAYIVFEQNQKKLKEMEQKRMKQILTQMKQSKRRYKLTQINESIVTYEEERQKRAQQFEQKKMMDLQSQHQIKSNLDLLYKSKFRSATAAQQVKTPEQKMGKHQKLMKMLMYSERVKQNHLPKIDQAKKQQLLQSIHDQAKKQNKIEKIKDGQVVLLDKNQFDPREIGLQYLDEVKKMTSLIPRKPVLPPSPQQFKLVDKALAKKTSPSKHITISNWKKIVNDQTLTEEQKKQKLEDYFKLIQQERLNVKHNKRYSSMSRSIQLQKKMDHYELQKAAAKLAFLKSMM